MRFWWLLAAFLGSMFLFRMARETVRDRREHGEWIWQTAWRQAKVAARARGSAPAPAQMLHVGKERDADAS